jgi:poly-beta-1,6-N-acetyl-D-glucosamine N-deacetylase
MKKGAKIFSSILGVGVLTGAAFAAYPYVFSRKPSHVLAATAPVPLTHVNKEGLLGTASATEARVPESGKDSAMNQPSSIGEAPYQNKVVIVTFHDISPKVYSPYVITPNQFSADLAIIGSRFHVITNTEFINFLNHKRSVPTNAVLLTFDDGYQGMYSYALPILLQHHMSGTFFDIVGTADKSNRVYLTWGEMRQMVQDGMSVESHTYASHYEVVNGKRKMLVPVFNTRIVIHGKRETIMQYHQRVLADFSRARSELENHLNEPVLQFAWPYGWGTPFSDFIAHEAGYQYLYTTTDGCVTSWTNKGKIPRIDIGKPFVTPSEAANLIYETANGRHYASKHMNHL